MTAPSPPRLSALVIACNEAAQLGDCLATLAFADEIVVVLDRTTDASAEIARAHGARVIEGAWEIEGERRNAGLDACTGDWILEVDADERVPPALAREVRRVIAASAYAWHQVPVDNYVGRRLVRHGWGGSFGTTAVPRLSRRGAKRWKPQRVHPGFEWRGREGPRLTHALVHYVDRDISDMLRRLDRYTDARAADLVARGEVGSTAANLRRFVARFCKCYFARGGWREGGWGLLVSLCAGLYPLLAHLKAKLEPERHGAAPREAGDAPGEAVAAEADTAAR
jgi:glycosyltransferase involved in cell wall biosynthesis